MNGFKIMWKDKPLIHVEWGMELGAGKARSTVLIGPDEERHPNVPLPFWNNTADFKYVLVFIERRNVPRTRFGIEEILKWYGVDFYDPMAMVRKNHGVSMADFIWILFDDEKPLKFADVTIRRIIPDILDLDTYKVFGSEGSGNQRKVWVGDTLIKLNSKYHEAEKEYSAYMFGKLLGFPVIEYKKGKYTYNGVTYNGCECKSFKQPKEESVTLYTLLEFVAIPANLSALDYFNLTINAIEEYTSGKITKQHASVYLKNMMLFDYLICNSDRHLSNIEILYNNGAWRFAPYFDNGQAFLLRGEMPSKSQFEKALRDFKTLPFSRNPVKNLIDTDYAKRFIKGIDINKVKSLNINSYHKRVILHQINTLL